MTMSTILSALTDFNPYSTIFRLVLAASLGGIIGWERGRHGHVAGMRTHILVCIGSAMALLVGIFCSNNLSSDVDVTRIGAQVISGIGFLGVGTILIRNQTQVTGVTTAAGLWVTAAIGLASGAGFYGGAVICTAIVALTMSILVRVEKKKKQAFFSTRLYAELSRSERVVELQNVLQEMDYTFQDFRVCSPCSGISGHLGVEMNVCTMSASQLTDALMSLDYIDFVVKNH